MGLRADFAWANYHNKIMVTKTVVKVKRGVIKGERHVEKSVNSNLNFTFYSRSWYYVTSSILLRGWGFESSAPIVLITLNKLLFNSFELRQMSL